MNPVTDKQKELIQSVEHSLGISFRGTTKGEAYLWLKEHVPKTKKPPEPVTDKQRHAVEVISSVLSVPFEGTTKGDAYLWLKEHVPKAAELLSKQLSFKQSLIDLHYMDSDTHIGLPQVFDLFDTHDTPTIDSLDKSISQDLLFLRFL